jgi:hypothetical protein
MRLHRHQSRRALLFGLGTLALVQLTAALLVTWWMPWLRQADYGHKVQRLEALQARKPARSLTILALGTSRTLGGLDGELAESVLQDRLGQPVTVCNFGLPGGRPFTHLLTLRRLLADGHRPDFLIVEVIPVLLHADFPLDDTTEGYVSTVSLRRSELSYLAHYARGREVSRLDWWMQWLSPVHAYRNSFLAQIVPGVIPPAQRNQTLKGDAWGWFPLRREKITPAMFALGLADARKSYAASLAQLEPGGDPLELLTTLLELCRREQIPTAMLLMPEGHTFRGWYGPGKLEHCRVLLNGLSHRFGIPVIDALEWIDSDAEYFDSHHLLASGAETFTRRLAGEALPPLLRPYPGHQPDAQARE